MGMRQVSKMSYDLVEEIGGNKEEVLVLGL